MKQKVKYNKKQKLSHCLDISETLCIYVYKYVYVIDVLVFFIH